VSLEDLGIKTGNKRALILAKTLDIATEKHLEYDRSPRRMAGELDNRGSHFYLTMYWAKALSEQNDDKELKKLFTPVAKALEANESVIMDEIKNSVGKPVDLGGYYLPDKDKVIKAMRPSETFNRILASIGN
jgi:isocitrate dehydrogenase